MADYKEMYLHMAREMARAADILLKAQQRCEEMYVEAEDAALVCMPAAAAQQGDDKDESAEKCVAKN